jgi:hypothetical protein
MNKIANGELLVGFQVLTEVVMKSSILWYITSCSPLNVNQRFGGTCPLHLQGIRITCSTLVSHLPYSSTLKTEVTRPPETSVDFQRTTRRYIPENRTLRGAFYFSMEKGTTTTAFELPF